MPTQDFLLWVTTLGLPEEREAATELRDLGVKLHPIAASRLSVVLIIGLGALAAAVAGADVEMVGAILGGGALAVSYVEWMLTRREASMDNFYDRLVITNNYRRAVSDPDVALTDMAIYVFSELDNLEYTVERYRFGYMSPTLARRGVNTFRFRFGEIPGFREKVDDIMNKGCAYTEHTCALAKQLARSSSTTASTMSA